MKRINSIVSHRRQSTKSLIFLFFLFLASVLCLLSVSANAEVYKCRNAQGSINFQERPCDGLAPDEPPNAKALAPSKVEPARSADQENVVPSKQNNFQIPPIPESWVSKAPGTRRDPDIAQEAATVANSSSTQNETLQTASESNQKVSQAKIKPYTPSMLSRLGVFLPIPFALLAALGWAIPWMRMMARSALDGRQRTPMIGALYRGYWWRGACAGTAFALAWISQTEGILWALALLALIPIIWSIKLGQKFDFNLFGEFDYYERQDFPDLYDESMSNEYEIQDGAAGRVIPQLLAAAGMTAFFYWGISGFHSNSLFGGIATWLSALFTIFAAIMTFGYLALLVFLMFRSKETFH